MTTHELFMLEALEEAKIALEKGETPVGCVIVKDGAIIARAHNERETENDPTAHAEMLAIRRAAKALGNWRLSGTDMYVTLEPCPMCAGAISQSRVEKLFFGATDPQQGCAGSVYRIPEDPAFSSFCRTVPGVLEAECQSLLNEFFTKVRELNQKSFAKSV